MKRGGGEAAAAISTQQQQMNQQQFMMEQEAAALAAEMFDHFCSCTTMRQVLGLYRNMLDILNLRPGPINEFYPILKSKLKSWKAQALWKKFDTRAAHRVYNKGTAAAGTKVLVIGAGPCGLRTAVEAQLLGAKVVVVEKRDRISRNNVLHLWPFVITDLRLLGAKKFYGKFCAGSIDHISIRQLQCILLKVALLLGVEVHEGVSFVQTIEPRDGFGWRAQVEPDEHAVSHFEFDVLIGADGKRNTLEGFKRKEFRGKLAIAITANFINKKTEAEAKVEEISGVAFIFNQSFFKELYQTTGIDLENIVYYKDETHYFVMTAKKHSLIDKGVIIQDYADPAELLSQGNVDTSKLLDYAREAAEFSTKYQMPNLEFAVNHYGKPDVAMFDFTSMFAAENSCRVMVRKNYRLLSCLVGDSLLEPFWPTGSGCARGFLSSMDAAYTIKLFSNPRNSILAVLAQRESIYRLLAQTTPENLNREIGSYTLDPSTRYPNLNKASVMVQQVKNLLDSDDPTLHEQTHLDSTVMASEKVGHEMPLRRKRRTLEAMDGVLLRWLKSHLKGYDFAQHLTEAAQIFTQGQALCLLIHRFRPDLIDLETIQQQHENVQDCNEMAFALLEQEFGIPRVMTAAASVTLEDVDRKVWVNYLEAICEMFRGEVPHVKHPKLDYSEFKQKMVTPAMTMAEFSRLRTAAAAGTLTTASPKKQQEPREIKDSHVTIRKHRKLEHAPEKREVPQVQQEQRKSRKRRTYDKFANIDRERGIPSAFMKTGFEGQFSDRIKDMEQQITAKNSKVVDKKPKDLLRSIGKIDQNDWNVKEIEKKIELSKKTTDIGKSRERVPKWSREQFLARQNKLTSGGNTATDEKYKDVDDTLKAIDKKLKEGAILESAKNKVASIAGQFKAKEKEESEEDQAVAAVKGKEMKRPTIKPMTLTGRDATEKCHFCKQRVYLMEKVTAENLILHRSCLKCHHCHTSLRLGNYAFDRDDPDGKFYCTQHYRLPAKEFRVPQKRPAQGRQQEEIPAKATAVDLIDRGQTPERIEFENSIEVFSEGEPSLEHVIDENEWTDKNFGTGSDSDDDLSSSDESDSSDDSVYDDPIGSPLGAHTLQLANDWIDRRFTDMQDSDDDFYEYSSEDDEAESQTEGEELARAREIRMQEVKLMPLPKLPTDTETDAQSDSDLDSREDHRNSATEISTDSEFEHDQITLDPPKIFIDDTHLRRPTKVQVKSGRIESQRESRRDSYTGLRSIQPLPHVKPLVEIDPSIKLVTNRIAPLQNPRPGDYLLSKTASTEGIASKKSLELKKRYLLGGDSQQTGVLKSESASALDTKLRSFHSNISECQKLLNPANDISPAMKTFLSNRVSGGGVSDVNNHHKVELGMMKKEQGIIKNEEKTQIPVIDLTNDSPAKDRSLAETKVMFSVAKDDNKNVVPDILSNIQDVQQHDDDDDDNHDNNQEQEGQKKSHEENCHSPILETSIEVPNWPILKQNPIQSSEMESDSLSESSTSSIDEIPHFILNETNTTTPDTFVKPTFEIRNESGDVMQMDSLMIVNGEYVGYPDEQIAEPPQPPPPIMIPQTKEFKKFDTRNENMIDTLKNIPLKVEKPNLLDLKPATTCVTFQDDDKTPTAQDLDHLPISDTETEVTGQVLTETELSDWTADDVVSENFVNFEATRARKNRKHNSRRQKTLPPLASVDLVTPSASDNNKGILNNLANFDELEFADTGSEESCIEKLESRDNKNKGYMEFVTVNNNNPQSYNCKSDSAYSSSPKLSSSEVKTSSTGINYIEQGASILRKPATHFSSLSSFGSESLKNTASTEPLDSLEVGMEEDSLVMITSTETVGTTTEESEALTVVTSPLDSIPPAQIEENNTTKEKELSITEYVNQLQAKISEISATTRKLSKEEPTTRKLSKEEPSTPKIFSDVLTEPPTLSKKIEMITKERVKQKDLIHDLVMDKLQQKKKLNAEKRLNRSRNRTNVLASMSSSATTTTPPPITTAQPQTKFKAPYTVRQVALKDSSPVRNPLAKFASFSYTDKLREEARTRARLLSNEDLGLSPEDKIQQLRKKYNLTPRKLTDTKQLQISKSVSDILLFNEKSNDDTSKGTPTLNYHEIYKPEFTSDPHLNNIGASESKVASNDDIIDPKKKKLRKERERRRSLIQTVSDFFHKRKEGNGGSVTREGKENVFSKFRLSPKKKDVEVPEKSKVEDHVDAIQYERSKSEGVLASPYVATTDDIEREMSQLPAQETPLPAYESIDDDGETKNELKRIKAITKASRQAELKRLRVAQEIEREQEENEVKIRDLELRGVEIEKSLRGEGKTGPGSSPNDQELLKELFEIWRQITKLKKHDEELVIRQKELQLEHRHAQLKEQLELRLSCNKLDKSSSDVAAEGAILNEMLDIVAKRASLRPQSSESSVGTSDINGSTTSSSKV